MEKYTGSATTREGKVTSSFLKAYILSDMKKEYSLRKSQLDPSCPSPNLFMHKLEKRMKAYYSLYRSKSRSIE